MKNRQEKTRNPLISKAPGLVSPAGFEPTTFWFVDPTLHELPSEHFQQVPAFRRPFWTPIWTPFENEPQSEPLIPNNHPALICDSIAHNADSFWISKFFINRQLLECIVPFLCQKRHEWFLCFSFHSWFSRLLFLCNQEFSVYLLCWWSGSHEDRQWP